MIIISAYVLKNEYIVHECHIHGNYQLPDKGSEFIFK